MKKVDTSEFKQAQQQHQQGLFEEALSGYLALLEKTPNDIELLHTLGILYAQMQQPELAIQTLQKALKISKKNAMLLNSLGNVYLRCHDFKAARQAFTDAIKIKADYAVAYNNLGNCDYRQGQLDDAKQQYQQALNIDPEFADAYFNLGLLAAQTGDRDGAVFHLKKTLSLIPTHTAALTQLGHFYLEQQKFNKAIEYYKKRLHLSPNHPETQHSLGIALFETDKLSEAIQHFEQCLALQASHPECQQHLANAYLQSGDHSKALSYYLRQLEVNANSESYYNVGVLLSSKQRHKEALQYLEKSAEADPGYLPTFLNLGALYLKLNSTPKALENYRKALMIKPNDTEIQHIITALSQADTPDKAPEAYIKHLFDQYATYYDKHLTDYLSYKVPQQLAEAIFEETGQTDPQWKILDLGCGTGLGGQHFKALANELIGIDIAEKMVDSAREKDIYNELKVCDVEQALAVYDQLDLIIAADVFTYIGDLSNIFQLAQSALKKKGLFTFSVERTHEAPYILQQSIRYAHAKTYIEQLSKDNNFEVLRCNNIVLRKQKNQPVEGYLVVLKKP